MGLLGARELVSFTYLPRPLLTTLLVILPPRFQVDRCGKLLVEEEEECELHSKASRAVVLGVQHQALLSADADLAVKSSCPRTPRLLTQPTRRDWSTGCTKNARCRTADLAQVRSASPLQEHAAPPVRQAWRKARRHGKGCGSMPFCALYLDVKLLVHIAFGKLIADTWLGNSSKIKDAGGTPVASAKQHPPNWPHEHLPHQGTPETTPHQLTTVVDINLP
ncbi:hypothetical protein BHM03_00004498 [Ensete ventricosum]|nr:hypothetical protein BHM03_00004498 [Ensete ventricosum]